MKPVDRQYAVWHADGYYSFYDTLIDAVQDNSGSINVYICKLKRLGKFKIVDKGPVVVRVKSRRKK